MMNAEFKEDLKKMILPLTILIGGTGALLFFTFKIGLNTGYHIRIPSMYKYVAEELSKDSDIDYTMENVEFEHYDKGITGGLYMYTFILEGSDGDIYIARYKDYKDLSRDTVDKVEFILKE